MIRLHVLASGSSGNAALLCLGEQRLLLDAGVAYRRLVGQLAGIGESVDALDAVLLTHEHLDHVRAVPQLVKRHPALPILSSPGTVQSGRRTHNWTFGTRPLVPGRPLRLGDAEVLPFATQHDARQPIGLRVTWKKAAIGLATDLGRWDRTVTEALDGCHLVMLEANHDRSMLASGPYPDFLKRRVASNLGHLSNLQARELLQRVAGPALQHVVLVHLSGENNDAETALNAVRPALAPWPQVKLTAAHPREVSPVVTIEQPDRAPLRRAPRRASQQLALPL